MSQLLFLFIGLVIFLSSTSAFTQTNPDPIANDTAQVSAETSEETLDDPQSPETLPVPIPASYNNLYQRDLQLAAVQLGKESVWLDSGVEKILAAWQEDASGDPQGALLMVVRPQRAPLWDGALEYLRNQLPEYGWASFLLVLPAKPEPEIPPRPEPKALEPAASSESDVGNIENSESDDQSGEPLAPSENTTSMETEPTEADEMTEEAESASDVMPAEENTEDLPAPDGPKIRVTDHATVMPQLEASLEERTQLAINAAVAFLKDQGQLNLAVMNDGELSQQIKKALGNTEVAAHIILSRESQLQGIQGGPDAMLGPQIPTLDMYYQVSPARAKALSLARKRQANTQKYIMFRQYIDAYGEPEQLDRRVRGFLKRYAKGMEVN